MFKLGAYKLLSERNIFSEICQVSVKNSEDEDALEVAFSIDLDLASGRLQLAKHHFRRWHYMGIELRFSRKRSPQ